MLLRTLYRHPNMPLQILLISIYNHKCSLPECPLEEWLELLLEAILEALSNLLLSFSPDTDAFSPDDAACTEDNFPFDTTYSVQKPGMHSEILEDILLHFL